MIQKALGRPRKYDVDKALSAALLEFRQRGYSATSLDNLVEATGMNRPSLYTAFGSKKDIFLKSFAHFRATTLSSYHKTLFGADNIEVCLIAYFDALISSYTSEGNNLGCPLINTIGCEDVADADFKSILSDNLASMDAQFVNRLNIAKEVGELSPSISTVTAGQMLSALQHSVAIRSRAGHSQDELSNYSKATIATLLN